MRKLFLIIMALVACTVGIQAQTVTWHGSVVDATTDEPLVGATVMPIGGGQGTATDVDGQFTLKVPSKVTEVQVSYIGYHTIKVPLTKNMVVKLKTTDQTLDDVMVVAFGTTKKEAFTGSAAVVKSDELARHITTNVTDALAGSVPGLQIRGGSGAPGSSGGSVKIRGISSLYAGTSPLVIVDGAPYTASLSNIPQNDIESISVLKDAASAALYGARGASGVIIITTKRGNTADAKVNVDMKWGVNTRAIQEYDVFTDPGEYYEAYFSQLYNYSFYGQGKSAQDANAYANSQLIKNVGYNVYTVPDGQNLIGMDGKLNPNATLGRRFNFNGMEYYMTPDNWTDLAYQQGFRQEYGVSATGGTDRMSYYSSLNYLTEEGVVKQSSYNRVNARLKADYRAKDWLKLGANVTYTHSKTVSNPNLSTDSNSTNIMYYTSMIAPIYPAYVRVIGPDGKPMVKIDQYGHETFDYGVPATGYGVSRPFLATGNPLGNNRYNDVFNIGNQLNGTFSVDVNFTSWLKFNATSTVIWGETQSTNYQNPYEGPKVSVNGDLEKSNTISFRTNNIQTLTYSKSFGVNNVNFMIGHEWYKTDTRYLKAEATGGFSPEVPELNAFAKPTFTNSYHNRYNVEGYFLNGQYNYSDKYYGSVSYRRDASSYFAKNHRWGDFWSVGGAWVVNKESFMDGISDWMNYLKVKFSIGQQGNDNIGSYAYVDMYSLSKASETQMSPVYWRMGNEDITWETTTNINGGIEFGFLNNRINGNIDLYTKKTSNLLFWLSIPESMGSRGYYGNIGDIRNSGVEFSITGKVIDTKDYSLSLSANISHNSTKILKLPRAKTFEFGGFFESPSWYEEGGPLYNRMIYLYAGTNEQGEATYWVDKNLIKKNGTMETNRPGKEKSYTTTLIGEASRYCVGSVLPKAFGGFNLVGTIKDFDFSASFDYQLGGKIYDSRYASLMTPSTAASGSNFHKDVLKSWTPDNTQSNIPRWQYTDQYTVAVCDRFLTNASYLNFQSFTVGYNIPKKLFRNYAQVRVYVAGQNLCFWSARKGLDPRYSFTSTSSMNVQSPVRTIMGGVQVNF